MIERKMTVAYLLSAFPKDGTAHLNQNSLGFINKHSQVQSFLHHGKSSYSFLSFNLDHFVV